MTRIGVLGGGISGLAMSYFLGPEAEVLEAETGCGGLARSFQKDGFSYDYGGHILFSRDTEILEFMLRMLEGNVERYFRNNRVFYNGRFIKYPFENDLGSLPKEETFDCLYHFLFNDAPSPTNFKEWLYATFGKGIAERYLIPYNEKIWNIDCADMNLEWVEGRVPKPPREDVIKSALGIETEGYTHQLYFYYPRVGGNQALMRSFERKVRDRVTTGFRVRTIERRGGEWLVSDGVRARRYDHLVSCIPIYDLIEALPEAPNRVRQAVRSLRYNSLIVVLVGLARPNVSDKFAVYIPQRDVRFHRICFYSYFGASCAPPGTSSVVAEITANPGDGTWEMSDPDLVADTVTSLDRLGFIEGGDVCVTDVQRTKYAYVVQDRDHPKNKAVVYDYLRDQGLHTCGRFADLNYVNQDMALRNALGKANDLRARLGLGGPVDVTKLP